MSDSLLYTFSATTSKLVDSAMEAAKKYGVAKGSLLGRTAQVIAAFVAEFQHPSKDARQEAFRLAMREQYKPEPGTARHAEYTQVVREASRFFSRLDGATSKDAARLLSAWALSNTKGENSTAKPKVDRVQAEGGVKSQGGAKDASKPTTLAEMAKETPEALVKRALTAIRLLADPLLLASIESAAHARIAALGKPAKAPKVAKASTTAEPATV